MQMQNNGENLYSENLANNLTSAETIQTHPHNKCKITLKALLKLTTQNKHQMITQEYKSTP